MQIARSLGIARFARRKSGVVDHFSRKNLEGNEPVQAFVVGTIDDAHSTGADAFHNAIMPQYFPSQRVATHVAEMVVCAVGQVNSVPEAKRQRAESADKFMFLHAGAPRMERPASASPLGTTY